MSLNTRFVSFKMASNQDPPLDVVESLGFDETPSEQNPLLSSMSTPQMYNEELDVSLSQVRLSVSSQENESLLK